MLNTLCIPRTDTDRWETLQEFLIVQKQLRNPVATMQEKLLSVFTNSQQLNDAMNLVLTTYSSGVNADPCIKAMWEVVSSLTSTSISTDKPQQDIDLTTFGKHNF